MLGIFKRNSPQAGHGAYSITITFTREHDEDDEIANDTGRNLTQQLLAELQEAYDCGHIAGHYRIESIGGVRELG